MFNLSIIANTENNQLKVVTHMYTLKSCQWPFVLSEHHICTIKVNGLCCKLGDYVSSENINNFCDNFDCDDCVNSEICIPGSLRVYCFSSYKSLFIITRVCLLLLVPWLYF